MKAGLKASHNSSRDKTAAGAGHAHTVPTPGLTHHCFGCAPGNRQGLRLRFQENLEAGTVECVFRMPRRFEGPPGHLHGGIIATVLDEAMGKVNRQKKIVALTRRMSIDYLLPVPLQVKLHAVGWPVKVEGRKHFHAGEIRTLDGVVLARSEGMFIAIDPVEMFGKHGQGLPTAKRTAAIRTAKLKGWAGLATAREKHHVGPQK